MDIRRGGRWCDRSTAEHRRCGFESCPVHLSEAAWGLTPAHARFFGADIAYGNGMAEVVRFDPDQIHQGS